MFTSLIFDQIKEVTHIKVLKMLFTTTSMLYIEYTYMY